LGGANEIYAASLIYTDEMLTEVTDMISDAYHNIRSDYEIILQVLEEKLNIINSNRAELMDGLQEMDPDDRNQQMLEIGQLLSSELYNSRMKARSNPDEYGDGSIQLSLDLQEEQEEKTRQAEEKAQRAEEALAKMMAERDALAEKVEKLKQDGMKATLAQAKPMVEEKVVHEKKAVQKPVVKEVEQEVHPEKVEAVLDEKEKETQPLTEEEKKAKEKELAEAIAELEKLDKENETIPLIPHFKKSQPVASVPSEQVAQMANAITTEKKYSGLIGRAVKQREKAQIEETVKVVETTDVKVGKDGKEYVQATMTFDDNYEITEF